MAVNEVARGSSGSMGAKNDVAWTAPAGVAGTTETMTVHDERGRGTTRSRRGGPRETARVRARHQGEREWTREQSLRRKE